MVNDLFAGQREFSRNRSSGEDQRKFFATVAEQVQRNLGSCLQTPSAMRILASYYTQTTPEVDGRPFCVALADCTFLFHMQMGRIPIADVDMYAQLIADVIGLIDARQHTTHSFMTMILRDRILGLPSSTCTKTHSVVLIPPHQYQAFEHLATVLTLHDKIPNEWVDQWHQQLQVFAQATSPMVSFRASALLVRTATRVSQQEQIHELHGILKNRKNTMNIDHILTCYERLKRVVPDPERGGTQHRALAIHCSEIFLKFRSPVRRDYVERYLYPCLCSDDMQPAVYNPNTREHLTRRLLRQCVPQMSTSNPFYLSLCALMHREMFNEYSGAKECIRLMRSQMPHAAYAIGTLATDTHMSLTTFCKIVMVLTRAAAFAMTGRSSAGDEVAQHLDNNPVDVYNILFTLREIARNLSVGASRRSEDGLSGLKRAIPEKTIDALGKLSTQAFEGRCEVVLEPQLLCAELGMVVHELNIDEAVDASVDHFRSTTNACEHCGAPKGSAAVCPVQGTPHIDHCSAAQRLLTTLVECSGSKVLEKKLVALLRDPVTQNDVAVHYLLVYVLSNAGHHRLNLFRTLEPYIRNSLITIVAADQALITGDLSFLKANIMTLNVKMAILMNTIIDASYVQSILKTFSELQIRNNHDALVVWYLCNFLIRNGRANVELMPIDPVECNYGNAFPMAAPKSTVAADNAQLILQLMDRSLSCSPEMRKLTGATVCKLMQDFCVQMPNIVSSILSPCNFVSVSPTPLHDLALPIGGESTFWTFVMRQMRSSPPARTAFMTTLAKCISQRFRNHNPSQSVSADGSETTGHVFTVFVYEAMKRNASLSRNVLHLISSWLKQKKHLPGKFACLAYCATQLASVVLLRHNSNHGDDAMEAAAEPAEEKRVFEDAVASTVEVLSTQLERMDRLLPEVIQNAAFASLLKRIHLRTRLLIGEVTNQPIPHTDFDDEMEAELDHSIEDRRTVVDGLSSREASLASHLEEISLGELQNADDDDVFSSIGNDDDDHYDDAAADGDQDFGSDGDYRDSLKESIHNTAMSSSHRPLGNNRSASVASSSHNVMSSSRSAVSVPRSILVTRSQASSLGPSVSMRPPQTEETVRSRSASASKGTQTAVDAATSTSFSDEGRAAEENSRNINSSSTTNGANGNTSQGVQTSTVVESAGDTSNRKPESSATKGGGSYYFKRVAKTSHQEQQDDQEREGRRRARSPHSDASSGFLRRTAEDIEQSTHAAPVPQLRSRAVVQNHLPSDMAMQLLMRAQNADSLIHEFGMSNMSQWGGEGGHYGYVEEEAIDNRYHAPHQNYVAPVQHVMAEVVMEPRRNNYEEPNGRRVPQASSHVLTHLAVREVQQPHDNVPYHQSSKRRRLEDEIPPLPSLQQSNAPSVSSSARDRLEQVQQYDANTLSDLRGTMADGSSSSTRHSIHQYHQPQSDYDRASSYSTPHAAFRAAMIPEALVEQVADSALREIGLAARGSTYNAQQFGGSSAKRKFTSQQFEGAENEHRWHTLSSAAPMPSYAEDVRYSMEF